MILVIVTNLLLISSAILAFLVWLDSTPRIG
jgi:hypothetical protein